MTPVSTCWVAVALCQQLPHFSLFSTVPRPFGSGWSSAHTRAQTRTCMQSHTHEPANLAKLFHGTLKHKQWAQKVDYMLHNGWWEQLVGLQRRTFPEPLGYYYGLIITMLAFSDSSQSQKYICFLKMEEKASEITIQPQRMPDLTASRGNESCFVKCK